MGWIYRSARLLLPLHFVLHHVKGMGKQGILDLGAMVLKLAAGDYWLAGSHLIIVMAKRLYILLLGIVNHL